MDRPEPIDTRAAGGFDRFAHQYDSLLNRTLRIAGEKKDYFARSRIEWLAGRLQRLKFRARTVMDFGCGTGSTIPLFFELLGADRVIALEDSAELLNVASRDYAGSRVSLARPSSFGETGTCDLVFCSAVFHHVPPAARIAVARQIHDYLRRGGLFALWEHNAWSPAARFLMSRCEFDQDARPLSARSARKMLVDAGFEVLATDFLFVFPKWLRVLRWSERPLASLPVGAQFQVLGRKVP